MPGVFQPGRAVAPLLAPARLLCFSFSLCCVCMGCLRHVGGVFVHSIPAMGHSHRASVGIRRIPTFWEYSHFSFPLFFESGNEGEFGGNGECRMVIGFRAMN